MLFHEPFILQPHLHESVQRYLMQPPKETTNTNNNNDLTIGIHARHKKAEDDGSDMSEQISCLESMLDLLRPQTNSQSATTENCTIFIMADRPKSLQALSDVSRSLGCWPVTVNKTALDMTGASKGMQEHGEFASEGYFQDFLVVSQARSGFIHSAGFRHGSSASALVWQEIVYRGIKEGMLAELSPLDVHTNWVASGS